MAENNWQRAARYAAENAALRARSAILDAQDLVNDPLVRDPPVIAFRKRADGVWVMPEA